MILDDPVYKICLDIIFIKSLKCRVMGSSKIDSIYNFVKITMPADKFAILTLFTHHTLY